MGTNRLEAFSDGVIAVAITLLVLNITVPTPPQPRLAHELATGWPHYVAYVVLTLAICGVLAVYYALPVRSGLNEPS